MSNLQLIKEKINDRMNEYDLGYIYEYKKPDGSTGIYNKLDANVARIYKKAVVEETESRIFSHVSTITVLVLSIVIVLMIMLIIYINNSTDITGIYYDSRGNKIEVYHNKTFGNIEIKSDVSNKKGLLKKINANTYGIYLDEDIIIGKMEQMSHPIAAYADLKTGNISWKNDIWKLDQRGYIH